MSMLLVSIILQVLQLATVVFLACRYVRLKKKKEDEYYTDYIHNNLVLRVYKPEYEYQAVGNISVQYLLDRGRLSPLYDWVLIDKRGLVKSK